MVQNIKLGFEENGTSKQIVSIFFFFFNNSGVTTVIQDLNIKKNVMNILESANQLNYKTPRDDIKIFIFNGETETARI